MIKNYHTFVLLLFLVAAGLSSVWFLSMAAEHKFKADQLGNEVCEYKGE